MVLKSNPSKKISNFSLRANPLLHLAPSAKLCGAGATLILGGGVIYIRHVLSASEMLEVAIS